MEERNIALAEPGSSEVYFRAWGERAVGAENTIVWSNNSDLLNKLRAVCRDGQCCIKTLYESAVPMIPPHIASSDEAWLDTFDCHFAQALRVLRPKRKRLLPFTEYR